MSSAFGPKKMVKGPKETFLAHSFCVRKPKKRGGKRGRTGGGGGIYALSNGTVLPHIDWNLFVCSCSFRLFFYYCTAKKARYMSVCLCVKQLSFLIKFFWIELNWTLKFNVSKTNWTEFRHRKFCGAGPILTGSGSRIFVNTNFYKKIQYSFEKNLIH